MEQSAAHLAPPLIRIVWRRKRAESLFSPVERRLLIDRDSPLSAACDPFFFNVGTGGKAADAERQGCTSLVVPKKCVHVEPVGARSLRKVISCVPNCTFPLVYLKAVYFSAVHLATVVPNQSNFFFFYY